MHGSETALPVDRPAGLRRAIDGADRLLLGLDFDGTLAPIVDEPDAATIAPAAAAQLEALAVRDDVTVAVVSGRALGDLRERIDVPVDVYAGNHGLELCRNGKTAVHPIAAARRSVVQAVCDRLTASLADRPGCHVENKGLTATVHVREASAEDAADAGRTVRSLVGEASGLTITPGKAIHEIRPTIPWDKGRLVRLLLAETTSGCVPLYVGDDTTDEDAFREIRDVGLGVRVGSADETAATLSVPGQSAVPELLSWLSTVKFGDRA